MKMQQKRYSEAFKNMVLEEIRTEKWTSVNQAANAYNIAGRTIERWIDRSGLQHLHRRILHVQTKDDITEIEKLKAENKRLKEELFNAMLDQRIEHATLVVACRKLNTTPEELKKKAGTK